MPNCGAISQLGPAHADASACRDVQAEWPHDRPWFEWLRDRSWPTSATAVLKGELGSFACRSFPCYLEPYRLYTFRIGESAVTKPLRKGAEEARNELPRLLIAAQQGRQTIITRHGRPVAILTPISEHPEASMQRSLLPLAGSGRVHYGRDSRATLRRLRDEWSR